MPKEIKQITNFHQGTINTPSAETVPDDANVESWNVNPMAQDGTLFPLKKEKDLFVNAIGNDEADVEGITRNAIIEYLDVQTHKIEHIGYSQRQGKILVITGADAPARATAMIDMGMVSWPNHADCTFENNNTEVHIGLGNYASKWIGKISHTQFGSEVPTGLQIEDAELIKPGTFGDIYKCVTVGDYHYGISYKGNYVYKFNHTTKGYIGRSLKKFDSTQGICYRDAGSPNDGAKLWVYEGGTNSLHAYDGVGLGSLFKMKVWDESDGVPLHENTSDIYSGPGKLFFLRGMDDEPVIDMENSSATDIATSGSSYNETMKFMGGLNKSEGSTIKMSKFLWRISVPADGSIDKIATNVTPFIGEKFIQDDAPEADSIPYHYAADGLTGTAEWADEPDNLISPPPSQIHGIFKDGLYEHEPNGDGTDDNWEHISTKPLSPNSLGIEMTGSSFSGGHEKAWLTNSSNSTITNGGVAGEELVQKIGLTAETTNNPPGTSRHVSCVYEDWGNITGGGTPPQRVLMEFPLFGDIWEDAEDQQRLSMAGKYYLIEGYIKIEGTTSNGTVLDGGGAGTTSELCYESNGMVTVVANTTGAGAKMSEKLEILDGCTSVDMDYQFNGSYNSFRTCEWGIFSNLTGWPRIVGYDGAGDVFSTTPQDGTAERGAPFKNYNINGTIVDNSDRPLYTNDGKWTDDGTAQGAPEWRKVSFIHKMLPFAEEGSPDLSAGTLSFMFTDLIGDDNNVHTYGDGTTTETFKSNDGNAVSGKELKISIGGLSVKRMWGYESNYISKPVFDYKNNLVFYMDTKNTGVGTSSQSIKHRIMAARLDRDKNGSATTPGGPTTIANQGDATDENFGAFEVNGPGVLALHPTENTLYFAEDDYGIRSFNYVNNGSVSQYDKTDLFEMDTTGDAYLGLDYGEFIGSTMSTINIEKLYPDELDDPFVLAGSAQGIVRTGQIWPHQFSGLWPSHKYTHANLSRDILALPSLMWVDTNMPEGATINVGEFGLNGTDSLPAGWGAKSAFSSWRIEGTEDRNFGDQVRDISWEMKYQLFQEGCSKFIDNNTVIGYGPGVHQRYTAAPSASLQNLLDVDFNFFQDMCPWLWHYTYTDNGDNINEHDPLCPWEDTNASPVKKYGQFKNMVFDGILLYDNNRQILFQRFDNAIGTRDESNHIQNGCIMRAAKLDFSHSYFMADEIQPWKYWRPGQIVNPDVTHGTPGTFHISSQIDWDKKLRGKSAYVNPIDSSLVVHMPTYAIDSPHTGSPWGGAQVTFKYFDDASGVPTNIKYYGIDISTLSPDADDEKNNFVKNTTGLWPLEYECSSILKGEITKSQYVWADATVPSDEAQATDTPMTYTRKAVIYRPYNKASYISIPKVCLTGVADSDGAWIDDENPAIDPYDAVSFIFQLNPGGQSNQRAIKNKLIPNKFILSDEASWADRKYEMRDSSGTLLDMRSILWGYGVLGPDYPFDSAKYGNVLRPANGGKVYTFKSHHRTGRYASVEAISRFADDDYQMEVFNRHADNEIDGYMKITGRFPTKQTSELNQYENGLQEYNHGNYNLSPILTPDAHYMVGTWSDDITPEGGCLIKVNPPIWGPYDTKGRPKTFTESITFNTTWTHTGPAAHNINDIETTGGSGSGLTVRINFLSSPTPPHGPTSGSITIVQDATATGKNYEVGDTVTLSGLNTAANAQGFTGTWQNTHTITIASLEPDGAAEMEDSIGGQIISLGAVPWVPNQTHKDAFTEGAFTLDDMPSAVNWPPTTAISWSTSYGEYPQAYGLGDAKYYNRHLRKLSNDSTFTTGTPWTFGTGWSHNTSLDNATSVAASGYLEQTINGLNDDIPLVANATYTIRFKVVVNVGTGLTFSLGGSGDTPAPTGMNNGNEYQVFVHTVNDTGNLKVGASSSWGGSITDIEVYQGYYFSDYYTSSTSHYGLIIPNITERNFCMISRPAPTAETVRFDYGVDGELGPTVYYGQPEVEGATLKIEPAAAEAFGGAWAPNTFKHTTLGGVTDSLKDCVVKNYTDGSEATITAVDISDTSGNGYITLTAPLSGGITDIYHEGDMVRIMVPMGPLTSGAKARFMDCFSSEVNQGEHWFSYPCNIKLPHFKPNTTSDDAVGNFLELPNTGFHSVIGPQAELNIKTTGNGSNSINNAKYWYAVSWVYDGYQDGPLGAFSNDNEGLLSDGTDIEISLQLGNTTSLSKRISGIKLWKAWAEGKNGEPSIATAPEGLYRLIKDVSLESSFEVETIPTFIGMGPMTSEDRTETFIDNGPLGGSYESVTGISQVIEDFRMNYSLSCQLNNSLFIADLENSYLGLESSNYIAKSMPYKFNQFDVTRDILRMPFKATAIAAFQGRIYVFGKNKMARVEPNTLFIEDTFDGVGCLGPNAVLVNDYGMFFADQNGIYLHNGQMPEDISYVIKDGIVRDLSGSAYSPDLNLRTWKNMLKSHQFGSSTYDTVCLGFDKDNKSLLVSAGIGQLTDSTSSGDTPLHGEVGTGVHTPILLRYCILKKRWDIEHALDVSLEGNTKYGITSIFNNYDNKTAYWVVLDSASERQPKELQGSEANIALYKKMAWKSKDFHMGTPTLNKIFSEIVIISKKLEADEGSEQLLKQKVYVEVWVDGKNLGILNGATGGAAANETVAEDGDGVYMTQKIKIPAASKKGKHIAVKVYTANAMYDKDDAENIHNDSKACIIESIGIKYRQLRTS